MGDGTTDEAQGPREGGRGRPDRRPTSLKNEGKVDRATGKTKDAVGDAGDKVKDAVGKD